MREIPPEELREPQAWVSHTGHGTESSGVASLVGQEHWPVPKAEENLSSFPDSFPAFEEKIPKRH